MQNWSLSREDAFNEYVRGTMREDVEKEMFASPIDYKTSIIISFPGVANSFEHAAALYLAGVPLEGYMSQMTTRIAMIFFVFPWVTWSVYYLAERFCAQRRSLGAELATCLALSTASTLGAVVLFAGGLLVSRLRLAFAFAFFGITASLALATFWMYPRRRAGNRWWMLPSLQLPALRFGRAETVAGGMELPTSAR